MLYHEPVLTTEVLEFLNVEKGKKYIDATLGDGGHTVAFLRRGAEVLGIDYNEESLRRATSRIKDLRLEENFIGVKQNFKNIDLIAKENGFDIVDGIIFDLGYSSTQLEDEETGLSFQTDAPLDMRLDESLGVTAADLLNVLSETQLERMFREFGEENLAKRYAKAIVDYRSLNELQTTTQLAKLLADEAPSSYDNYRIHPATRVFQALRLVVNNELENLNIALPRAARLLKLPGGRMGIISFQSLEDKVVKEFGHSVRPELYLEQVTKKPVTPKEDEIEKNPRARSAKLRVFERNEMQKND